MAPSGDLRQQKIPHATAPQTAELAARSEMADPHDTL